MNNVMADLETLSTRANAVILSIGACEFGTNGIGRTFYQTIYAEQGDRHVCPNTAAWWEKQPQEAKDALPVDRTPLRDALLNFGLWLPKDALLWGNGSDFDNAILADAFTQFGDIPWKFYNNRCYRTVKSLFPVAPMQRIGTHHNALDDAISQANHLIAIRNRLRDTAGIDLFNSERMNEILDCIGIALIS